MGQKSAGRARSTRYASRWMLPAAALVLAFLLVTAWGGATVFGSLRQAAADVPLQGTMAPR